MRAYFRNNSSRASNYSPVPLFLMTVWQSNSLPRTVWRAELELKPSWLCQIFGLRAEPMPPEMRISIHNPRRLGHTYDMSYAWIFASLLIAHSSVGIAKPIYVHSHSVLSDHPVRTTPPRYPIRDLALASRWQPPASRVSGFRCFNNYNMIRVCILSRRPF